MIKIEIKPSQALADTRSGVSKATGKPYTISEQSAYIFLGGDYPQMFKINLENGQSPYPAGIYSLHESSIYVGDFQKLRVGKIVLVPYQDQSK
ncbi:single-stranded DNA-binding protein [Pectobacterium brasiliense]|uniref:single-stranded DNA-binding protein n=1 Tax=Pectobacterium brasiliense TaxID=180957 RepID=UPI000CE6967F|nr:single-stranded DNA-binding protein [Pectobacterium brasiliense]MBN3182562.1 DNA-binding protein [Pectobacterium brasiliense]MDY4367997.1 single-stranded DNA-binding protein [Pectobacterium brasiliense]MDY4368002.1 single-stranded DNA-binding protein [Pectobacterium brasiliense]MDY7057361.1 single-stranded DNA-binding protein [Pectobacterium brasiliense]MDY7057367.1 single-stranded DNA-binding protein [Pectobacterium brasiliense]